jgi:hypothetical protein
MYQAVVSAERASTTPFFRGKLIGGAPGLLAAAKLTVQHRQPDFAIRGAAAAYPIKSTLQNQSPRQFRQL